MPRKEQTPKKKTPKKKTKEKSPKRSEDPKMDEDEINRLMQNALDQANARAEQKFEERLTALREEFNQKHQEEMNELQEQLAQSRGGFTTQEKHTVKELMVDAVTAAHHNKFFEKTPHVPKKFIPNCQISHCLDHRESVGRTPSGTHLDAPWQYSCGPNSLPPARTPKVR